MGIRRIGTLSISQCTGTLLCIRKVLFLRPHDNLVMLSSGVCDNTIALTNETATMNEPVRRNSRRYKQKGYKKPKTKLLMNRLANEDCSSIETSFAPHAYMIIMQCECEYRRGTPRLEIN